MAQAAGFIAATGMLASQYLGLLRTRAGQLLDRGALGSYPRSLAAATALIADRLADHDPAAAELASLCAFLSPEPIPEYLFTRAVGLLPGELTARTGDPLAWRETLANVSGQSLARIDHRGLQMHRLTQAILRDRLGEEHPHTLMAAHYLAWAFWELGRYAESRDLDQDTLERRRHVLGHDHPDTLSSARNLALDP